MNDAALVRTLCAWFDKNARDLPWRRLGPAGNRDLFVCLVSEIMLQQTQVSRVAERFTGIFERFPDAATLAASDESELLAMWSGLGYYRRARSLHKAAREIVERHEGRTPSDAGSLKALSGVGRYTAGAIASIGANRPEPIVDGNVTRVLLRLKGQDVDQTATSTQKWLWQRSEELVLAAHRSKAAGVGPGKFNEALMELGATVCTPKSPGCETCPWQKQCAARIAGSQDAIPSPKKRAAKSTLYCVSVLDIDSKGRRLIEQRDESGLWASMWQAPTFESPKGFATEDEARSLVGARSVELIDDFSHATTHRDMKFRVYRASGGRATGNRQRKSAPEVEALALSTPQRKILLGAPDA